MSKRLMREVLTPRAYSAVLFKDEVLTQACVLPEGELDAEALAAEAGPNGLLQGAPAPRTVDIGRACDILRRWQNKADGNDRGALLWEALWARLEQIPAEELYGVAFSSDAPLDTPGRLRAGLAAAAKALAATALEFSDKGWPLDGALGTRRYVAKEEEIARDPALDRLRLLP
ncbi:MULTISPECIES: penicillin acylase family protein [Achromobacter]|uniref:penicillin acylase family protein n=1 Tax=Achromobacter sp. SD115 TaxID=2782011 RepID=UPI001A959BAA|nr:penicillin acylase family protein [Achromobacter sp. SD115]